MDEIGTAEAEFVAAVVDEELLGEIVGMVFVEGVDPATALTRFAARPETVKQRSLDEFLDLACEIVGHWDTRPIAFATALAGWTMVVGTYEVAEDDRVVAVSRGCRAVGVMRHDYAASHSFSYAVDGALITEFPPEAVWRRQGDDADRLAASMAAVGLPLDADANDGGPDRPVAAALHLAARIVGRLPALADLAGPLLTADLALNRMTR
ncbi:DUF6461 domain-containing protein [Micromonospora profundi]|uniref:DUF6461 domain-containing protein n=1 Tax=Micromonospora TaxID=1873 RepID=UPI0006ADB53F|nr:MULTISPECIES: DUF6461 domain-containing protein [Micromonospora]NJC11403.1 hypothetical protein [Micromonospora profundi]